MDETKKLAKFLAPFNKEIELHEVSFENETTFLRTRIKEGHRFTIVDIDPVTAQAWGEVLTNWAELQTPKKLED